jgi:chemotaxis protein CheX
MDTEELTHRIAPDVVAELVALAWETFLGPSEMIPTDPTAPGEHDDVICSAISIGGPWSATLLLHVSGNLARRATALIIGVEPDELDPADVRDIIGELANIVGGNVKGCVSDADAEWTLSLPVVSDGMQTVPGSRLTFRVGFLCDGEPIGCEIREHA